jgi:hypothetical protein
MVARGMRGWLCGALIGALAAAPAAALESASGSYEGKLKCKGLDTGSAEKTKQDVEVGVFDEAGSILMNIEGVGTFFGFLLTNTSKPETGTFSAVSCALSAVSQTGQALHADVKINAGSEKGSLKGKLIRMDVQGEEASLCELKVDRVSALAPKLSSCP